MGQNAQFHRPFKNLSLGSCCWSRGWLGADRQLPGVQGLAAPEPPSSRETRDGWGRGKDLGLSFGLLLVLCQQHCSYFVI